MCDVTGARTRIEPHILEVGLAAVGCYFVGGVVIFLIGNVIDPPSSQFASDGFYLPPPWGFIAPGIIGLVFLRAFLVFRAGDGQWARIQLTPYNMTLKQVSAAMRKLRRPWYRTPAFLLLFNLALAVAVLNWAPGLLGLVDGQRPTQTQLFGMLGIAVAVLLLGLNAARLGNEGGGVMRYTAGVGVGALGCLAYLAPLMIGGMLGFGVVMGIGYQFFGITEMSKAPPWFGLIGLLALGARRPTCGEVDRAFFQAGKAGVARGRFTSAEGERRSWPGSASTVAILALVSR